MDNGATHLVLTKAGDGTLDLTGGASNTYGSGAQTYLAGGTVLASALTDFGLSNLTFNGGTLKFVENGFDVSSRTITLTELGGTADTNGLNVTFQNPIGNSGGGDFVKTGAGTLTLNGVNTYTGRTIVNGGTLAVGAHNGGTSGISSLGSAIVNNNATLQSNVQDAFGYDIFSTETITLNGGTLTTAAGGPIGSGGFRTTLEEIIMTGGTLTSPATNFGDGFGVYSFNFSVTTNPSTVSSIISATSVSLQANPNIEMYPLNWSSG